jgi:hypothetical protein
MPPWWESDPTQQPDQQPVFKPSESPSPPLPESWPDITITGPSPQYIPLLLPLHLLAPFSDISTMTGVFPAGYFCTVCGRINVQRFLRHCRCENATCTSRKEPQRETGWAASALSTRDPKVYSATFAPSDIWDGNYVSERGTAFEDGTSLYHYRLAIDDSTPSAYPSILHPSCAGADTHAHSVRHVFNGNKESLQGDASALFETLQRDVPIERSISSSVFATPLIESRDDPALGRDGPSAWDQ